MPRSTPAKITAKGNRTRQRIVDEAGRIFSRDGFRKGSLAAIAEAVGVSQQGLLHYFPTKADLLVAVLEQRDQRTAEYLARHATGSRVDAFVEGVRHNALEPHLVALMTVLSAESISPDHPTHDWFVARYDREVAKVTDGVRAEQDDGTLPTDVAAEELARVLVALADGLRLQRLLGHEDFDHAELLGRCITWFRTGSFGG